MKSIIIYATRYGSTAEAARRIKEKLGEDCMLINIMTDKVPALDSYETVVLGGSIYVGRVQKQLTAFLNSNLNQLLEKNIGLFLCAGAPKPEERAKELQGAFPSRLLEHAAAKDVLGYAFSFEKMRFLDRAVMKKIKGDSISTAEYFDQKIARFAELLTNH